MYRSTVPGFRRAGRLGALLATTALVAVAALLPGAARAQDATWLASPATGDFNTASNWNPNTAVPTGTAFFGLSNTTSLSFSTATVIGGWTFNAGASAYSFANSSTALDFTGAGIIINGGSASIINNDLVQFYGTSTAGSASIANSGGGGHLVFNQSSTAGSATITTNSSGLTSITGSAAGGTARFILNGTGASAGALDISGLTTGGTTAGSIEGDGNIFLGANNLAVGGNNLSTTFSGVIKNGGAAHGIGGSLTKTGTGTLILSGTNTYTGGTTVNAGTLQLGDASNTGKIVGAVVVNNSFSIVNADTTGITSITNNGITAFSNGTSAGSATITNNRALEFFDNSTAGNASITNNDNGLAFFNSSTAGSATITTASGGQTFINDSASGGTARFIMNGGGLLDISGLTTAGTAAGSIEGAGNIFLGSKNLAVGGNNLSTTFSGVIQDGGSASGTGGSLTKTGTGTLILSGHNTYTGATQVSSGTLAAGSTTAFSTTSAFTVNATLDLGGFSNTIGSLAGSGTVTNSSATAATLTTGGNNTSTTFSGNLIDGAGALGLTKTGTGTLTLTGTNTYTGGTTLSAGTLQLSDASNTGKIVGTVVTNGIALLKFSNSSTADGTTITNNAGLGFYNTSTAGSATITNTNTQIFFDSSTAGSASITNTSTTGGFLEFTNSSTAGGASITNNSGGLLEFLVTSTAGNAIITNNSGGRSYLLGSSSGGTARYIMNGSGLLDLSGLATSGTTAGSIEGDGNVFLGTKNLAVGGNNLSTTFSGVIQDGGVGGGVSGSLTKTGTGKLILSGTDTYTGATTISGGVLEVDGAITNSSGVTVNAGGTLTGTGLVDPPNTVTVASGGMFAPGNGTPGSSMTVAGNLAFQSGALYVVSLNPTTSSFANVTGTATLGGANVSAVFANGSYVAKQYMILSASSVSGAFGSVVNTNLPSGFRTDLSSDPTHAYLDLSLAFIPPPGTGLSVNQRNVANTLTNFFNTNGSIPLVFGRLAPAGLTQLSGETGTGSQQATFDAMGQFMGLLTDPFMNRTGGDGPSPGAAGFAAEEQGASAYAARKNGDAYAMFTKAPPFVQRWSVWGAGFGGSQSTDGNAAVGSNNTTSHIAGTAVGADYLFSPNTLAGFALAGGGTSFSVAGGGSGRSDLFQAGAYLRHTNGPAYLSAALAYGWQDITTDRTVTVAGFDHLRAEFNANAFSGRAEGGYRFVSPWMGGIGITPYAAGQFTTFDLPSYAEQALTGANTFALAYGSRDVTDTRSELGIRSDKSYAMQDGIFTLRSRLAWAHDFNPDRSIAATFQALPGASFVVNGAAQASDSALVTVSAEKKWLNGWSAAATFEGESSQVTASYAGKGVVRYAW